jgi:hypothetical protein
MAMTTQCTSSMTSPGPVTAGRGVARRTWRKVGAAIHEMNYAAGRVATPRIPRQPEKTGA